MIWKILEQNRHEQTILIVIYTLSIVLNIKISNVHAYKWFWGTIKVLSASAKLYQIAPQHYITFAQRLLDIWFASWFSVSYQENLSVMSGSLNYPCSQETTTQDSAITSSGPTSVVGTVNTEITTTHNTKYSVTTPSESTTSVAEESTISTEITTTHTIIEISTENSHANVCCVCKNVTTTNVTKQEVDESVSRIRLELLLEVKSLNSYRWKKTSVSDRRASSVTMGTVAAIVLVAVCSLIVIADLSIIMSCFRSCQQVTNHTWFC